MLFLRYAILGILLYLLVANKILLQCACKLSDMLDETICLLAKVNVLCHK
jgi:hypothetical protein